jgi:4-amino-4-deoxy-L-arabinose transferase-like glycosyltransferase
LSDIDAAAYSVSADNGMMLVQADFRFLRWATIAFFAGFLLTGLFVFNDYGVSWDEIPTREFGLMNVEHAIPDAHALDSLRAVKGPAYERFGPLFEIMLVRAEKLATPTNRRATFLLRHLLTFLTFYLGVVLFHQLCRRRFGSGIALLSAVCLATSPQLFSHAFYNTKDISFLTAFVAAMLTLDTMLSTPTWRTVLGHALTTTVLLGVRIIGLFAVLLTGVAALARRPSRRTLLELFAHGVVIVVLLPVVWPVLRIDPIGIVRGAVLGATSNPYTKTDLFRGQLLPANALPWDYVPTWILITTPLVVLALFVIGVASAALSIAKRPREHFLQDGQRDVIVLCWFVLPVMGTVILKPMMYDAWRHLFFLYPALIYLAAIGMETTAAYAVMRFGEARRRMVNTVLTSALLLSLSPVFAFMVANHPLEHLYFNRFAGRDMAAVKQRFELDYWGLSYRQALELIVRSDWRPVIRLHVANYPGMVNSVMLPLSDRKRLQFVPTDAQADYFVTNYRFHPENYPFPRELFSIRVGNASVASVFRLRHTPLLLCCTLAPPVRRPPR